RLAGWNFFNLGQWLRRQELALRVQGPFLLGAAQSEDHVALGCQIIQVLAIPFEDRVCDACLIGRAVEQGAPLIYHVRIATSWQDPPAVSRQKKVKYKAAETIGLKAGLWYGKPLMVGLNL